MAVRLSLLAALGAVALLHAATFFLDMPPVLGEDRILAGPDAYMRLMQAERLWESGDWFDRLSPLTNAPAGEVLHWTRPFDLVLLAGAWPLSLHEGMRDALYHWGAVVSPFLHLLTVAVLWWGTRFVIPAWGFVLTAILLYLQPAVRAYFLIGRPDHHSLQILLFAVAVAGLLRLFHEPGRRLLPPLLGIAGGLGIWVSVEGLLGVFVVLASVGILWLMEGERHLRVIADYLAAAALTVTVALFLDRPPAELTAVEYDRISVAHWALFAAMAVPWIVFAGIPVAGRAGIVGRTAMCVAGAAVPAVVMAVLFPKFFGGPFVDVDPRMVPLWLEGISEVEPLVGGDLRSLGKLVFHLGPLAVTVPFAIHLLRRGEEARRHGAVLFLVALAVVVPMALYQVRWAVYVQTVAVVPWTMALAAVLAWEGRWRFGPGRAVPLRVPAFLVMLLAHLFIGGALFEAGGGEPPADKKLAKTCEWARIADTLVRLADERGRPSTIVTFVHQGPEVAWRTGQGVVGSPYQRNVDGVVDTHAVLGATDMEAAHAAARRRGVDVIAVCAGVKEAGRYFRDGRETLMARLVDGLPPPWLRPVEAPATGERPFIVMEVVD